MRTIFLRFICSSVVNCCLNQSNIFFCSGNAGIGTVNPQAIFHVIGSVRVDGGYLICSHLGQDTPFKDQYEGHPKIYNQTPNPKAV